MQNMPLDKLVKWAPAIGGPAGWLGADGRGPRAEGSCLRREYYHLYHFWCARPVYSLNGSIRRAPPAHFIRGAGTGPGARQLRNAANDDDEDNAPTRRPDARLRCSASVSGARTAPIGAALMSQKRPGAPLASLT